MTGNELQALVKSTEVKFSRPEGNIYEFPTGRQLCTGEVNELIDLDTLEQMLIEWD